MIIDVSSDDKIPANDRIAQYGDGCFTTMCVTEGDIELIDLHMHRLKHDCRRLQIDFQSWESLSTHLTRRAKELHDGVLKAIISRGTGGRGYSTLNVSDAHCYVSNSELPTHYLTLRQQGISLSLSDIKLGSQPLLAGIKHCNRLEQVLIKVELQQTQSDDLIVCNYQDQIRETSVGNLFWRKDTTWMTPILDDCGVAGVMRNHILRYMKANNINVLESNFKIDELIACDEMFVCNSLMKIVPVNELTITDKRMVMDINKRTKLTWLTANLKERVQCE